MIDFTLKRLFSIIIRMAVITSMHFAPLGVINPSNPCNDPVPGAKSPPPCAVKLHPVVIHDPQIQSITDGLTWLALIAALVALTVSAGLLAVSFGTENPQAAFSARRGAICGVIAAFFVGALPTLINFWIKAAGG